MCHHCVTAGKMTQSELELELAEMKVHVDRIMSSLHNQSEEIVMNVLISCLINASLDIGIPITTVMTSLALGYVSGPIRMDELDRMDEGEIKH